MKKALLTGIHQIEVKIISEKDAPDTFAKNLPPGGEDKWNLIEYPDGQRRWHPKHSFTYATPKITDFTRVSIEVKE